MKKIYFISILILFSNFLEIYSDNLFWSPVPENLDEIWCISENSLGDILIGTVHGIYLSKDKAKTWNKVNFNFKTQVIKKISNGTLFAATYDDALFRSEDNGYTWLKCNGLDSSKGIKDIATNSIGEVFLISYRDGLYKSTDYGINWVKISNFPMNNYIKKIENTLSIEIDTYDNIFICVNASLNDNIYFSKDNCNSWDSVKVKILNYFRTFLIDETNNIFIVSTTNELIKSDDLGKTFKTISNKKVGILALDNLGNLFISAKENDNSWVIYISLDKGESWTNWETFNPNAFLFSNENETYLITYNYVYHKKDDSSKLVKYFTLISYNQITSIAFDNKNNIWAGSKKDGLFYSLDTLKNWLYVGNLDCQGKSVIDILFLDKNGLFTIIDSIGLYKSIDNGNSFTLDTIGLNSCLPIKVFQHDSLLFLATNNGLYFKKIDLLNWNKFDTNFSKKINTVNIDKQGNIFIGTDSSGIFKSKIDDQNFTEINTGLRCKDVRKIIINSKNDVFAGTWGDGIFKLDQKNESWIPKNNLLNSLPSMKISDFKITKSDELLIGILGYGVYYSNRDADLWEQNLIKLPKGYIGDVKNIGISFDSSIFVSLMTNGIYYSQKPLNNILPENAWVDSTDYYLNLNLNSTVIISFFLTNEKDVFYSLSTDTRVRKWDFKTGFIIDYSDSINLFKKSFIFHQIHYIDDSLAIIGHFSYEYGDYSISLLNYRKDSVISEIIFRISEYIGFHDANHITADKIFYDKKNDILFCKLLYHWTGIKGEQYTRNLTDEIRNFSSGKIIKKMGTSGIDNVLIDTLNNCYLLNYGKFIKIDTLGNTLLEFEEPYGLYKGIKWPTISIDRQKLSGVSSIKINDNTKIDYFIWDYGNGQLIDSIEHSNISEFDKGFYGYYPPLYSLYSWDGSKIIFSGINEIGSHNITVVKFWDILKKEIIKSYSFDNLSLSNLIIIPNHNSVIFSNIYDNKLRRIDFDNLLYISDENIIKDNLLFYPNPASNYIMLDIENLNGDIEIYNQVGIIVFESKSKNIIDISFLTPGIYFLKVNCKVYKFIKLSSNQ